MTPRDTTDHRLEETMFRRTTILKLLGLTLAGSTILFTDTALAEPAGTLTPFLDCVGTDAVTGNSIAFFGYSNTEAAAVDVEPGPANQTVGGPGGIFSGQPTTFNVGTYPRVFSVEFAPAPNALVVWQLNGQIAQANVSSPACQWAVTAPASAVRATAATLNGIVAPGGLATTYTFEYGTTAALGSTTPVADGGAGTAPALVQSDLTGLTANTQYYFRINATNGTGTTQGALQTFTTLTTLRITTSTLPTAHLNRRYATTLRAAGGAAPYSWSVASGSLPRGLSLSPRTGVLSGTPTRRGTAHFTVQVTGQATGIRSFALTVAPS
jgi:hypothetical protein